MGVNQFTDLSHEEIQSLYSNNGLSKKPTLKHHKLQQAIMAELPESVDWHKEGKMTVP